MTTSRFLLAACCITLVLRIAAIIAAPPIVDTKYEQLIIAKNAVEGRGFGMVWPYYPQDSARASLWRSNAAPYPSAFMPPFIPLMATTVLMATNDLNITIAILLAVQTIIGSLLPLLIYSAGIRLGNERTARYGVIASVLFIPGLLTSATPAGAVFYSAAGLMVMIYAHDVIVRRMHGALLGLSLGLLTLMRAEALGLGLLLCLLLYLHNRDKATLRNAFVAIVVMLGIVAPWTIRNTIAFGSVVPVVSHPWREMWRGCNEHASGSGWAAGGWEIWELERYPKIVAALDSVPLTNRYELEADKVFKREVVNFATNNPGTTLFLAVKKVMMFWTYDPYYQKGAKLVIAVPSVLCSFLILIGFASMLKRDKFRIAPSLAPYIFMAAFYSAVLALTYMMPRYQAYVFSILLPVCGLGIEVLRVRLSSLRGSS